MLKFNNMMEYRKDRRFDYTDASGKGNYNNASISEVVSNIGDYGSKVIGDEGLMVSVQAGLTPVTYLYLFLVGISIVTIGGSVVFLIKDAIGK